MTDSLNMAHFFVCDTNALGNNQIFQIAPPGLPPVAVYRVKDKFFATDNTCTHGEASLSEGDVDDDFIIECPFHGGTFDIRTGEAVDFPCVLPLKTYPVSVEDGKVYINLNAGQLKT
ncbi:non-heme iron oxygenase ferredoxin subunit [Pseudomonas sp. SST3]|jgi:nitrite reductase/ring-hydroxylating ferredoxin subunit|uniref:non-heme iron oxygenase ferredoxin subunit n=1 Tax=Pseudomonas sp. SST3 TaxID=2267882 RepID=UPI000DFADDC2|nr:non-heme iron oxygenase ferredoxin subunit [Pseudomonas sp. SST3]NKQ12828.1 non-heme iron oxygenase ferredoxin subunit [Pseudomonas sp. SST3]